MRKSAAPEPCCSTSTSSRHATPLQRPLLSTTEFLELSGATRKQLRGYERHGILRAALTDAREFYKYWTIEQAIDLDIASALNESGMSLAEIATLAESGRGKLVDKAREQCAASHRQLRRLIKRLDCLAERIGTPSATEAASGMRLRWIPQRYYALLPQFADDPQETPPPIRDSTPLDHMNLKRIAEIVGWAQGLQHGSVASIQEDGKVGMQYASLLLADCPMPSARRGDSPDAGCYRTIATPATNVRCENGPCALCERLGEYPSPEEKSRWKSLEDDIRSRGFDPQQYTLFEEQMAEPYGTGPWASVARSHDGTDVSEDSAELADRPQLMPHLEALPLGATAGVFPAGLYACKQISYNERNEQILRYLDQLEALERTNTPGGMESRAGMHATPQDPAGIKLVIGSGFEPDSGGYLVLANHVLSDDDPSNPACELQTLVSVD